MAEDRRPTIVNCPDPKCLWKLYIIDDSPASAHAAEMSFQEHQNATGHFPHIPFVLLWDVAMGKR